MANRQINFTIFAGMGKVGRERLAQYRERIKARGYKSLSRYIVRTMDRELNVDLTKSRESNRKSTVTA